MWNLLTNVGEKSSTELNCHAWKKVSKQDEVHNYSFCIRGTLQIVVQDGDTQTELDNFVQLKR